MLTSTVADLDSNRKLIRIRQAKGKKDRYVPFGSKLREILIAYYKQYKPKGFLFEGVNGGKYGERSFEKILQNALLAASIRKKATLHTLRHSYATHQLENATDLR